MPSPTISLAAKEALRGAGAQRQPRPTYTVRGAWPFPLDMLRHDGSVAASRKDRAMIKRLSGDHAPDRAAFQRVEINLTITGEGRRGPNTARWESFGWEVPADLEHQWLKRHREEEKRRAALLQSAFAKLSPEEAAAIRAAIARTTGGAQ